jgi:hypothetical protein
VATRAAIQKTLIRELGPFLAVAGLDGETQDTPNDSLENAIGRAIVASGGSVQDPPTVSDDDVASVTGDYYKFSVLGMYYLLDTIWGNWPYVDQKDDATEQKLDQFAKRLLEKQEAILDALKDPDILAALKVPGPPVIGRIKTGLRGPMYPYNPFTRGRRWP